MKSKSSKYVYLIVTVCFLVSLPKNGWSNMWDCGPPKYIVDYQNSSPGAQTSRSFLFSTTNLIPPVLITYSSASSAGTSGCGGSSGGGGGSDEWAKKIEQQRFLVSNWDELNEQTAQGTGPHLSGLATLMGCPPRHHDQFAKILRLNHAVIFSESSPNSKKTKNSMFAITSIIEKQPFLSELCHLHG